MRFVAKHPNCTVEDIRKAVGLKSSSSIFYHTATLVAAGALARNEVTTAKGTARYHFTTVAGAR